MLKLNQKDIYLAQQAPDWRAALHLAADILVASGCVTQGYRQALLAREAQSSTYVGQGIAIPHGTPEHRDAILATGVRVVQFPQGVQWHDGERVYLLVAMAAKSDEHLAIVSALARVLERDGVSQRLATATTPEAIVAELTGEIKTAKLDKKTLCVGVPAQSLTELVVAAAARLQHVDCVDADFVAAMAVSKPWALGQGVWLVASDRGVQQGALAIATPKRLLQRQGERISAVACLALEHNTHRPLLESLLALLEAKDGLSLVGLSADALLARLSGESTAVATAHVRLLSRHGLHVRPAKQLVQAARAVANTYGVTPKLRLVEASSRL